MNKKDVFYQDKEACSIPLTHIIDGVLEPSLREMDKLYGAADVLSIQNAEKHRRILMALSAVGTLLTLFFLLYDEAELHGLILACGAMILCLLFIYHVGNRLDCHRKYLEYRVLAESCRCQFFLLYAGTKARVSDIMPWSIHMDIPWVCEVLEDVSKQAVVEEGRPVLDCWIRGQKEYHEKALRRAEGKSRRNNRTAKLVLAITIIVYIAALLYELFVYKNNAGIGNENLVRAALKIVLGTMSAITLFTGSYYGKMSLSNAIDDHKRMIALYTMSEEEIIKNGESEEQLLFLAREFLNENSTWFAYQSKNGPDLVM